MRKIKIKNTNFILLIFLFTCILIFTSCKQNIVNQPKAKKGVLDISKWNFEKNGFVKLDGEWEFYWKELINPSDFAKKDSLSSKLYFEIPKLWKKFEINSQKLGSYGYATFRLKILVPEKNKIYSLGFERVETAYKIWADNVLIGEVGQVGTSRETMTSKWLPENFNFTAHDSIVYITIQVSNFNHTKGGIGKSIRFGTTNQINQFSGLKIGFDIFLLGALIIMALYHFGLYFLRKKEKSPLYFALTLIVSAFYLTVNGQFIAIHIIPNFNWELLVKINFITNYYRIVFFALFVGMLFKDYFSKKIIYGIIIWATSLSLLVLVTPARFYSQTLIILIIGALFTIVYLTFGLIRATIKRTDGAFFSLLGTIIMLLTAINDSLFDFGIIRSLYLTSFGMFIFVFFQAFMISMLNAKSHNEVEKLTERLLILDKIKKELLSISSFDLGKTLEILTKNFKATRGLMFLSENNFTKLIFEYQKNEIIKHDFDLNFEQKSDFFNLDSIKKSIEETQNFSTTFEYNKSIFVTPIFENKNLKAILYFENEKNIFDEQTENVSNLLLSQIAAIIDNANIYTKLEHLNKNLENLVEQRTQQLKLRNEEINEKNIELDATIEELRTTADVVESINKDLLEQKEEIEKKNAELERQQFDILEKQEEMLQQREEILTINEMLEKQQIEVLDKNFEITKKNQQITDSIAYAKRIQLALLRSEKNLPFADHFILYKPKDIVSGDFYWMKKFFNYVLVVAADCTGHGVPGAFMSMLGISFLSEVANKQFRKVSKSRLSASIILDELRDNVIKALSQNKEKASSKDGMDMALCIIDKDTNMLEFAGANNPAYIIRNNEIIELEADKMPIGIYHIEDKSFKNQSFQLIENDRIYLFSDGYVDQFGGEKKRKFLKKNFKDLLLEVNELEMTQQLEILDKTHLEWRGENNQTDDILVVGIKI